MNGVATAAPFLLPLLERHCRNPNSSCYPTKRKGLPRFSPFSQATRSGLSIELPHSPEEAKKLHAQLETEYKERYEAYKKMAEAE